MDMGNPLQPGNPVHQLTQPITMVTACTTHFNPNKKEQSWTAIKILFVFRVNQEQTRTPVHTFDPSFLRENTQYLAPPLG